MRFRLVAFSLIFASPLFAQDSSIVVAKPSSPLITVGVTTGTMAFRDQRVQGGVTGVLRYHLLPGISLAASPTFARVAFPSTLGGGSVSGLTDLPVEVAADHSFDVPGTPTGGLSLGVSLPVGDKQVGFGTGAVGANIGAGVGVSPIDALSFHLGAGKALNDYSEFSALGSSSSAWGDAEMSYQLVDHLEATVGVDGDIAAADS